MNLQSQSKENVNLRMVSVPKQESLPNVSERIEASLHDKISGAQLATVLMVVDEIYSNICKYSHASQVECSCQIEDGKVTLKFLDDGEPYNPLSGEEPDVDIDLEKREIGGLGVFLVKRQMDELYYEYADGKNCLTLSKYVSNYVK